MPRRTLITRQYVLEKNFAFCNIFLILQFKTGHVLWDGYQLLGYSKEPFCLQRLPELDLDSLKHALSIDPLFLEQDQSKTIQTVSFSYFSFMVIV